MYVAKPKPNEIVEVLGGLCGLKRGAVRKLAQNFDRNSSGAKTFQHLVEYYQRLAKEDPLNFLEYFDNPLRL